jgi:hypothetical protein
MLVLVVVLLPAVIKYALVIQMLAVPAACFWVIQSQGDKDRRVIGSLFWLVYVSGPKPWQECDFPLYPMESLVKVSGPRSRKSCQAFDI